MAENIKIYRCDNPRLGFAMNQTSLCNVYVDEESLRRLVDYINRQFLICSNKQTQCLIDSNIDPNNNFITAFSILIAIPFAKSIYYNDYQTIFFEYLGIFLITFVYLIREFTRNSKMRDQYIEAQEELQRNFNEIQQDFNSRFDYLQMEYNRQYNEDQSDFIEIKFLKQPNIQSIIQKKNIQLLNLEE